MSFNLNGFSFQVDKFDIINEFANFYNEETDFAGLGSLDPNNSDLNTVSNYISAAITLSQWLELNKPGNYTGVGTSQQNPYPVPLTDTQKCQILASLGYFADNGSIMASYETFTRYIPSIGNTYFNLNSNPKYGGIKWENEELVIYDVYNFEGIGDFGIAPPASWSNLIKNPTSLIATFAKSLTVIGLVAAPASKRAIVRMFMALLGFNPNSGQFNDGQSVQDIKDTLPFNLYTRDAINVQIGNVANLYIENRFTKEEICQCNPELYRDAVEKGYLSDDQTVSGLCSNIQAESQCFDAVDNVVPVGQAQPAPLLGFPYYTPRVMQIGNNPNSWNVGTNDRYPSPFTSFQQQITNNTHFLGPYAMWGTISGRICLIVGGANSGQKGFIAQCWDTFDDGNYNVDSDGIQYSSKYEWWRNTRKIEVSVPNLLFSQQPNSIVKVAVESFDGPGAENVWGPNYAISSSPFGSVNLSYLIPLVAITSRYF